MDTQENNISILHLSDLHFNSKTKRETEYYVSSLIEDLSELKLKYDFICFTGDLVDKGMFTDNPNDLFKSISNILINPLLEVFSLNKDRFFIVPGNHDVEVGKLNKYLDIGLRKELTSREKIREFLNNNDVRECTEQIDKINQFIREFQGKDILKNRLSYFKNIEFGNLEVGIICINTVWRYSSGKDSQLIVGERQIEDYIKKIKNCDIKICLMHHPTSYLIDEDKMDIENLLTNFDLVLYGHGHLLDDKQITRFLRKTIYCAGGRIYPESNCFNGYSILKIDAAERKCEIVFREYDQTVRKFKSYKENTIYDMNSVDKPKELAYYLQKHLRKNLETTINRSLISYSIDEESPKSFLDLFEAPCLSSKSEYLKEEDKYDESILDAINIDFDKLLFSDENIIFLGRKEIGKTSILNKFALENLYQQNDIVPFIIDLKIIPKGRNPIGKIMNDFLISNCSDKAKICVEEIEILLKNGKCLILIDNFEYNKKSVFELVRSFVSEYPANRYVITTDENIINSITTDIPDLSISFKQFYIQTFNKNQIRSLAHKWYDLKSTDEDSVIDNIVRHFNDLGIPRTPFSISIILSILNNKKSFNFINESSVMEMFMELLLEKLSVEELKGSSYNFENKERYLIFLATYMMKKNSYFLDLEEYLEITVEYHRKKGFKLSDSKFDRLFFEKNILVQYDSQVYFRYNCIYEYYLAKAALLDDSILSMLLSNCLAYYNELCFYTGLNRDSIKALKDIENVIVPMALDSIAGEKQLKNNYIFDTSLVINLSEIESNLKLSSQEKDELTDKTDNRRAEPVKEKEFSDIKDNIVDCVFLFGRMIRNSDEILIDDKKQFLDTYMWCMLYAILIISNIVQKLEHNLLERKPEEVNEKALLEVANRIKVIIPIAVQNMIVDNIGTKKLELTIKEKIDDISDDNFTKFMFVFLYSDLKMTNSLGVIEDYIKFTKDKDFLIMVNYKLYYYYITDHFVNSDDRLRSLIATTVQKTQGKNTDKSKIIQSLKKEKILGSINSSL